MQPETDVISPYASKRIRKSSIRCIQYDIACNRIGFNSISLNRRRETSTSRGIRKLSNQVTGGKLFKNVMLKKDRLNSFEGGGRNCDALKVIVFFFFGSIQTKISLCQRVLVKYSLRTEIKRDVYRFRAMVYGCSSLVDEACEALKTHFTTCQRK